MSRRILTLSRATPAITTDDRPLEDQHHAGTDYLLLARMGDHWRITQKAYCSDRPYKAVP